MRIFLLAISDKVMIILLQLSLLILVLYRILGSQKMKQDGVSVRRGEISWSQFPLAYGILSVIVIQVISLSESGKGYKVFITLVDLGVLLYFAFGDDWFRNKIIEFVVKAKTKEE